MEFKTITERRAYAVKITAQEDGKEVGRTFLYVLYNDLHTEPFGFLEDVFVEEAFRGQKIGSQLVELAVAEAKKNGCYKLIFTTRHFKPEVQAWYRKLGFTDWGSEFRMDLA